MKLAETTERTRAAALESGPVNGTSKEGPNFSQVKNRPSKIFGALCLLCVLVMRRGPMDRWTPLRQRQMLTFEDGTKVGDCDGTSAPPLAGAPAGEQRREMKARWASNDRRHRVFIRFFR